MSLLHEDATQSMPPYALWLQGREEIGKWLVGQGFGCKGARMLATAGNGSAAVGIYRVDPEGGYFPFSLQVVEVADGRITGLHNFLYPELFPAFGLPRHLD